MSIASQHHPLRITHPSGADDVFVRPGMHAIRRKALIQELAPGQAMWAIAFRLVTAA